MVTDSNVMEKKFQESFYKKNKNLLSYYERFLFILVSMIFCSFSFAVLVALLGFFDSDDGLFSCTTIGMIFGLHRGFGLGVDLHLNWYTYRKKKEFLRYKNNIIKKRALAMAKKQKEYTIAKSGKKSKTAKATISAKKAAEKRKKTMRENEKNRKIAAFNKRIFQQGYANPSMTKKESVWKVSNGCCSACYSSREGKLGFWWRIYPTLELTLLCEKCAENEGLINESTNNNEKRSRAIPENVKDSVWKRDEGKCIQCGSNENLEFDHIIPHSKGGANTKRNIQLLCEQCNRAKSDKIG